LNPEIEVRGVTVEPADHLRVIAEIASSDGAQIDPANDLFVSENWGYVDARGAVMPGAGRVTLRPPTVGERTHFEGLPINPRDQAFIDVYLNSRVFWRGIPEAVWNFSLGGYPVLKKWLSYRDQRVLGRALRVQELEQFQNIARRITFILALNLQLD